MGFTTILELLAGAFKFADEVLWLIRLLRGTPESHREDIMKRIRDEADSFAKTGRPDWGS